MKYIEQIRIQVIVLILLELIALGLLFFLGLTDIGIALSIFLFINIIMIIWIVYTIDKAKYEQDIDISRILGREAKGAFDYGEIGIIAYDSNYEVTWISDFLIHRNISLVGKKATAFIPGIADIFSGAVESVRGEHEGYIYEVARKQEGHILFVRDVSEKTRLKKQCEEDSIVVGIVHLDNYAEITAYEDENKVAMINLNFRQPVLEWAKQYQMMIRRLRSDRFMLVLNERIYRQLAEDRFSILQDTRRRASEMDVAISLSIAFASGSNDLDELDDMVNDLLELGQSRGGDQVVVKRYGEDVRYYGGNSEAVSKRSRVRVRVMAQAVKEAIMESNQVFITGHKEMDFDCMGANLALSRIAQAFGKKTYVVSESGGIEQYCKDAKTMYGESLNERHRFITDEEAARLRRKNDLMIAVDYHNPLHCNAPLLLDKMERIIVIDHHRRSDNYVKKPLLVYIESGASSSCELITEFLEYLGNEVNINDVEALFMYLGILVDTNHFKMRTGSRTFEAAAQLRKIGVDPIVAEDVLKENFDDFESKINIFKYGELYMDNMVIACVDSEETLSRTLMSMSADALLSIKNIEASFVIAKSDAHTVCISARSKGNVNVQRIMEEMGGGGHFSAAAVQKQNLSALEMKEKLMHQIDLYIEEGQHEGNIVE